MVQRAQQIGDYRDFDGAHNRGMGLLMRLLTSEQRATLDCCGYFDVVIHRAHKKRIYRLIAGNPARNPLIELHRQGEPVGYIGSYLHSDFHSFPMIDHTIGILLHLRTDDEYILKRSCGPRPIDW